MSVAFSAKISMLRKEKNITQRQAAQELNISQALLSHYEKGIRECNLDFVKKAAQYYGVTSDFLLGISSSKRPLSVSIAQDDSEPDEDILPKNIIRSLVFLSQEAADAGDEALDYFADYFALSIKKYLSSLRGASDQMHLCDISTLERSEENRALRPKAPSLSNAPRTLQKITDHADALTQETVKRLSTE